MTNYKGYEIETMGNESRIFLNGNFIGGTYSEMDKMTSLNKAKLKIDCLISGESYHEKYLSILKQNRK